jgi:predicted PurR-regulated permease PerM
LPSNDPTGCRITDALAIGAFMSPTTADRQAVASDRCAPAEGRPGPTPIGNAHAEEASQIRVVLRILFIITGIALGLWALHRLSSVVLALILAALLAYVIAPLVDLARRPIRIAGRRRRLSRGPAIAFVYLLMAGSVSGAAALLLPSATEQVNEMIVRAPAYSQAILTWEHGWSRYYERLRIPLEVRRRIDQSVLAASEGAAASLQGSVLALVGALSYVPWLLLIPILAFFLLKDAASLRRIIVTALPHHGQLRGHRLFEELNATLAAYIRAQLLACVLVGSLCGMGFAVLGIPYPLLLGVLAGVLEFIPLVGPLVLAIVAAVIGALHAPILALWAVGFLSVLRLVEDYVIYPRLMRRGIHLHPLAVILAVLVGAELDGVAGMFLSVPTIAIAAVVYRHWMEWRTVDVVDETPSMAPPRESISDPTYRDLEDAASWR